tara:strand:+ start:17943 stop:18356 length:414 start_codon:yes stop_codon:yes gene_type:complete
MIEITHNVLNPELITKTTMKDTNGGVVTFLGTTRDTFEDKQVIHLEYEAYESMALQKLNEIAEQTKQKYKIEDIAIAHRIGIVGIGEISLVVAVASPHRLEAFQACNELVDLLKDIVPIWKKEIYSDGSRWVGSEHI